MQKSDKTTPRALLKWDRISQVLLFTVVIVVLVYSTKSLSTNETALEFINTYGYVGIFLVSLVSGFNVVIPFPAAALIPLFAQAGLSTVLSLFIITVGMTLGDGVGYLVGRFGKTNITESNIPSWIQRFEEYAFRYRFGPPILLFLYAAFVPAPNELIMIPLAFLGLEARRALVAAFFGNAVFNTLVALGFSGVVMVV